MPRIFSLAWTPSANATTQTLKYRIKNTGDWSTSGNITPSNPMIATATSATVSGLSKNTIYQFQILSNCCTDVQVGSAIIDKIIYEQKSLTSSVAAGIISVEQLPMTQVNTIVYKLSLKATPTTFIQTKTATGTDTRVSFDSVSSGTYIVTYAYTTSVNGVNVNSYDADQNNAWYVSGDIVV